MLLSCAETKEIEIQKKVKEAEVDHTIKAIDLLKEYTTDEKAAESKYVGKIVLVEGKVTALDTLFSKAKAEKTDSSKNSAVADFIVNWFVDQINDVGVDLEDKVETKADTSEWTVHANFPTEDFGVITKFPMNGNVKLKCKCNGVSTTKVTYNEVKTIYWKRIGLHGCIEQK